MYGVQNKNYVHVHRTRLVMALVLCSKKLVEVLMCGYETTLGRQYVFTLGSRVL